MSYSDTNRVLTVWHIIYHISWFLIFEGSKVKYVIHSQWNPIITNSKYYRSNGIPKITEYNQGFPDIASAVPYIHFWLGTCIPLSVSLGTILLTPYSMVWGWRVSRAGPMKFYWPSCSLPFCLLLFSLSLFSFYELVLWGWGLRTDGVLIALSYYYYYYY